MTGWQKRARLLIAAFGVVFAGLVGWQLKPRAPAPVTAPVQRTDPGAVVESTGGRLERFKFSRQDVGIKYERQLLYANGTAKLFGVTIETDERGGSRSFTVTGKEGNVGEKESTLTLDG